MVNADKRLPEKLDRPQLELEAFPDFACCFCEESLRLQCLQRAGMDSNYNTALLIAKWFSDLLHPKLYLGDNSGQMFSQVRKRRPLPVHSTGFPSLREDYASLSP